MTHTPHYPARRCWAIQENGTRCPKPAECLVDGTHDGDGKEVAVDLCPAHVDELAREGLLLVCSRRVLTRPHVGLDRGWYVRAREVGKHPAPQKGPWEVACR